MHNRSKRNTEPHKQCITKQRHFHITYPLKTSGKHKSGVHVRLNCHNNSIAHQSVIEILNTCFINYKNVVFEGEQE